MEGFSRMSTIILHDKKNNNWNSLGIGPLQDAINPLSTRERNGIYDMTFQYPVVGKLFHELKVGRWIVADAGPTLVAKVSDLKSHKLQNQSKGLSLFTVSIIAINCCAQW